MGQFQSRWCSWSYLWSAWRLGWHLSLGSCVLGWAALYSAYLPGRLQGLEVGWGVQATAKEPQRGSSLPLGPSQGLQTAVLCLGWKKEQVRTAGRILMFAEWWGAGHGLASPFIIASVKPVIPGPSFTHLGPGSFWVWWAACGHLKADLESPWHPAWWPEGHSRAQWAPVRPHCALHLAEFRGQQPHCQESYWTSPTVSAPLASYYPSFIIILLFGSWLSLELCAEMYWVRAGTEEVGSVVLWGAGRLTSPREGTTCLSTFHQLITFSSYQRQHYLHTEGYKPHFWWADGKWEDFWEGAGSALGRGLLFSLTGQYKMWGRPRVYSADFRRTGEGQENMLRVPASRWLLRSLPRPLRVLENLVLMVTTNHAVPKPKLAYREIRHDSALGFCSLVDHILDSFPDSWILPSFLLVWQNWTSGCPSCLSRYSQI